MEIKTKFNLGDTVSVIADHKVKDFVIETIEISKYCIKYRDERYNSYPEDACFASRQELCDYILGNTNKKDESETNKDQK